MASSISASSSQSPNASANQSTVSGSGSVTITVGNFSGLQSWGRVYIGDTYYDTPGPTSMSQGSSWSWGSSRTYTHDINGDRGDVGVSVSFWVDGTSYHANSAGAATQGGFSFDRKPAAVTGTSATVNSDKSVTVSFGGGASPGGSPSLSSTYHVAYSQNGGAYTGDYTSSGSPITITGLTPGSSYVFRAWATNGSNDGASASSDSLSTFIPSGGKRWTGSAWQNASIAKRWDGTAWVSITTAKRWDGSSWINLS